MLAPAAAAQSVYNGTPDFVTPDAPPTGTSRVTFYGHVFASTLDSPMPANTQYPWGEADWGSGRVDQPTCGLPGEVSCDDYTINKLALFTTAGPVQVKETNDFSYDKLHNEHGMTQDVVFDTTQDVTATIHVSTAAHAWIHNENETPCLGGDPPKNVPCLQGHWRWHSGINPNFQVRAWLYAMVLGEHGADASEAPPIQEKWESGDRGVLIATGESTAANVISLNGEQGYERVWRFDVNLGKPQVSTVTRDANLVLVYSYHNKMPDGSEVVHQMGVRLNTGEFFPASFSIPVKNAFTVELVAPRVVHEKLVVVGVMNTPWGSYDLNPRSVDLTMRDEDGREVDMPDVQLIGDYSVAHGGHYRPINVTFVWDHVAHKLKAGAYSITLSAANYQGSAADELTAFIEVDENGRLVRAEPGRADVSTFTGEDFARFVSGADAAASGSESGGDAAPELPLLAARDGGSWKSAASRDAPDMDAAGAATADVPAAPPLAALAAVALAVLIGRRRWGA